MSECLIAEARAEADKYCRNSKQLAMRSFQGHIEAAILIGISMGLKQKKKTDEDA